MRICSGHISLYRGNELIDKAFFHSPEVRKTIIGKWRNLYGQLNRFNFIISHTEITPHVKERVLMYVLEKYKQPIL